MKKVNMFIHCLLLMMLVFGLHTHSRFSHEQMIFLCPSYFGMETQH